MSLLPLLREQMAARRPVSMSTVPSWAQSMPSLRVDERAQLRELNNLFGDQADLLRNVHAAWERGDFTALNRCLNECAAYFDPRSPHLLVYFVGLGGIDLFVSLLCDVNTPMRYSKQTRHYSPVAVDAKSRVPWDLTEAMHSLMRVLTELLVCHSELSWYYYDRFPGIFFRLLELARNLQLRLPALVMLEHLVLGVGPVLEISKIPLLQELIRTKDDATFAILCRVIALLIVPGVLLGQHDSSHPRTVFPESLLPLQRTQRVIDSNVLWLIGEKGLVRRLVRLCEVRASGDGNPHDAPTRSGGMLMSSMHEWSTSVVPPFPMFGVGPSALMPRYLFGDVDIAPPVPFSPRDGSDGGGGGGGGFTISDWGNRTMDTPSNSNNNNIGNNLLLDWSTSPLNPSITFDPERLPGVNAFGDLFGLEESASDAVVGSSVDFSWFVGCTDVKQRWWLRDLTLREDIDDNRPLLCGFGPASDARARKAFREQNQAYCDLLSRAQQPVPMRGSAKIIVSAQSEILFVINLMLSTFYFGDVWYALRECQWLRVATAFYDIAFDSHEPRDAQYAATNIEHPRQAQEWQQLPRFRATGGAGGVSETIHRGEDTEAYTRNTERFDDDEGEFFDESNHQHESVTIRKLELLRGVQEFWNAQDRFECEMLHEGSTAMQSVPLALKIAATLAKRYEDSCVEISACHALEGYLRCFSFRIPDKCAAEAPQTFIGAVLMRSILEHRVYNATYVPGLSGSLAPGKRIDGFFALLGELIRHHRGNLLLLQSYVAGDIDLRHLNSPDTGDVLQGPNMRAASQHVEKLLRIPPLDRGEDEAFAKVMLRRMYNHGCDTNLFTRTLLLSLTPGLRARTNYVWKSVPMDMCDAKESLSGLARIGDLATGHPKRLHYISSESRRFVEIISRRRRGRPLNTDSNNNSNDNNNNNDNSNSNDNNNDNSGDMTLWDMLQSLMRAPHRFAPCERPFPSLFDAADRAVASGAAELPPVGPPPALALPLFADRSDADGCRELAPLESALLSEPDRLVYSLLGPLNAERIQNVGRLCVLTTSIFVFLRVARLRGAAGVHEVLRGLRALAAPGHARWCRRRQRAVELQREEEEEEEEENNENNENNEYDENNEEENDDEYDDEYEQEKEQKREGRQRLCREHRGAADFACCAPGNGSARCAAFLTHGSCAPKSARARYYQRYGGCFFRNMFRLLCVWIGHYGACQRYIETLYYSTEVPFAEPKSIVLYLMRVLPDYFF